ncbi:hypothetical protein CVT26_000436 [Gymnopilus dilepis]|uniref:Uncharacterized protein n=1 Tax=Gymnopilus dilepis TaxID=231916 RepID=A0A409Y2H6_9AGAR|nr:hypothetical protein CVT26_000436 [Gymnopilus dilepis]
MPSQTCLHDFDLSTFRGVYSALFASWAEGEDVRVHFTREGVHTTDRRDRLREVAADFINLRHWPPMMAPDIGPRFLWDMFSFFVGISADCQLPRCSASDSFSGDEGNDEGATPDWLQEVPYWNSNEDLRLDLFLSKPETAIKIFLSSFGRRSGFVWSDVNMDCVAPVLEFFIKYVLRTDDGLANDPAFCACPALIESAKKELPDIAAVSKAIPDDFSSACYLFFGWGTPEHPGLCLPIACQDLPTVAEMPGQPAWEITRRKLLSRQDNITLKETHMPGVVEHSMRRVKSISLPTPEGLTPSAQSNDCSDADNTSIDPLLGMYARLILEPMPPSWDNNELPVYSTPEVLQQPNALVTEIGCHNATEDEITVIIDPQSVASHLLTAGMGLGGTWVQLISKKRPKSKPIWFIDHLSAIIPSFWTSTF